MADNKYYIQIGSGSTATNSKSWFMTKREAPMPDPKRVQITDIPYRDGAIDMSKADGKLHYGCRELVYEFQQSFADAKTAAKAIDTFVQWLSNIWNVEMYDSVNEATYVNVRCLSVDAETGKAPTVKVKFETNPFKKDGKL